MRPPNLIPTNEAFHSKIKGATVCKDKFSRISLTSPKTAELAQVAAIEIHVSHRLTGGDGRGRNPRLLAPSQPLPKLLPCFCPVGGGPQ